MRVSVVEVASSWRDLREVTDRAEHYRAELAVLGASKDIQFQWHDSRVSAMELAGSDALLLLVLSGGTEQLGMSVIARWNGPVAILAHPGDNALAAAMEILALARSVGHAGIIVQGSRGWREDIALTVTLAKTYSSLRRAVIASLGSRDIEVMAPWALEGAVREVWGPQLVHLPLGELVRCSREADAEAAQDVAAQMQAAAERVIEPDANAMLGSARIYLGLRRIVQEYHLDAVAVHCFSLLTPLANTACYALARLNDEGVPATCEADIPSCLTMLFMWYLTSQPSFLANPSSIDLRTGTVVFTHCTIPTTMCTRYSLRSHYESNLGVGITGELEPGPVTIVRIGGKELQDLYAVRGQLVECGEREDLCRTQLAVRFDRPEDARILLSRPLGNHHMVTRGDWTHQINSYCDYFHS
ncbi:MAG TPA: hypothetical protein PLM74_01000 [Bacillota bacterium]|nr:hypothetical protein [Bacillota bacterium]